MIIFDLDETLIKGDSARLWVEFCAKEGLMGADAAKKADAFHALYDEGRLDMAEFMRFFLGSVKGRSEDEIKNLVAKFIPAYIKPYKKALELVKALKNERQIIISATADFLVSQIAREFGIFECIAIQTERENGRFSGRTFGTFSFREGKITRLKEYLGKDYEALMQTASFYTDSMNDLFLLEAVKTPIACNPDPKLRQIGIERGYQILEF